MSRWFRHYAGMMRDEKLVRVAIKSKQPIERVLWVWGAALESAAEIDENGRFDLDPAEIAYFLRADESDIDAVLVALADAGRLADGSVVNWGDRQFSSDRSKERQAAYRERKRAKNSGPVACEGAENVTVTSRDGEVTLQETETETDNSEPNGSGAAAPSAADFTKTMWNTGKAILKASGHDDRQAGSILGRFRKTYSDSEVLTVISRCQIEQPSEPVEWITKALQAERNKANGRQAYQSGSSSLDAMRRAIELTGGKEQGAADAAGTGDWRVDALSDPVRAIGHVQR